MVIYAPEQEYIWNIWTGSAKSNLSNCVVNWNYCSHYSYEEGFTCCETWLTMTVYFTGSTVFRSFFHRSWLSIILTKCVSGYIMTETSQRVISMEHCSESVWKWALRRGGSYGKIPIFGCKLHCWPWDWLVSSQTEVVELVLKSRFPDFSKCTVCIRILLKKKGKPCMFKLLPYLIANNDRNLVYEVIWEES